MMGKFGGGGRRQRGIMRGARGCLVEGRDYRGLVTRCRRMGTAGRTTLGVASLPTTVSQLVGDELVRTKVRGVADDCMAMT